MKSFLCALFVAITAVPALAHTYPYVHNNCVVDNGNGTFTASYDYMSDLVGCTDCTPGHMYEEYLIGPQNHFTPDPADRGQLRRFFLGYFNNAFTTIYNGGTLTWTLDDHIVATADSTVICGATPGGGGGTESNGDLATLLAQRLFDRHRKHSLALRPARAVRSTSNDFFAGKSWIPDLVPSNGPLNSTALVTTPADLLGVTNANEIHAVDYIQPSGNRAGAVFMTATAGDVYNHTKIICDRLKGGRLESVKVVDVAGHELLQQELITERGETDVAISFAAIFSNDGTATIDSRWTTSEYEVRDSVGVLNFQVWTVSSDATQRLAGDIIERLGEHASVMASNRPAPQVPAVYVRRGEYANGELVLEVVNASTAAEVTISGTIRRHETGEAQPVSWTLPIDGRVSTVRVPTGPMFDATLHIDSDVVYYADGPWYYSYDSAGAKIASFLSAPEEFQQVVPTQLRVERAASLSGQVTSWASLFRFLRPNKQPHDLTRYDYVEFTASGTGHIELVLEKEGVASWWDQYRTTIELTSEPKRYRILFSSLKATAGNPGFTAGDVTSIDFNALGDKRVATPFDVRVRDLAFGSLGRRRPAR